MRDLAHGQHHVKVLQQLSDMLQHIARLRGWSRERGSRDAYVSSHRFQVDDKFRDNDSIREEDRVRIAIE